MAERQPSERKRSAHSTRRPGRIHVDRMSSSMPAVTRRMLREQSKRQAGAFFVLASTVSQWPLLTTAAVTLAIVMTVPRQLTLTAFGERVPYHEFDPITFALRFRFKNLEDLHRVTLHLRLGHTFHYKSFHAPSVDALAVTLARLAGPVTLEALRQLLNINWSTTKLSRIVQGVVKYVTKTFRELIAFDKRFLQDADTRDAFALAISEAGSYGKVPYKHIVGFIDGLVVDISRPYSQNQEAYFNGNEKTHLFHYLALLLPNGIMTAMYGPYIGESSGLFGRPYSCYSHQATRFSQAHPTIKPCILLQSGKPN